MNELKPFFDIDAIEGMCCDCKHDARGFYGDYSENETCKYRQDDGGCWEAYYE